MSKISITIPTYNRCILLQQNLEGLINQIETDNLTNLINIVVVDNCSTDETKIHCDKYNDKIYFKYIKNDINVGMERNFQKCVMASTGEYTWILSDDDFVYPGALKIIISALANSTVSSLMLNFDGYTGDVSNIIFRKYIPIESDIYSEKLRHIASTPCVAACFGFISSFIYKTEVVKNADWEYYLEFNSLFSMVGVIVKDFFDSPSIILHNSIVIERCEGWRDDQGNETGFSLGYLDKYFGVMKLYASLLDKKYISQAELDSMTVRGGNFNIESNIGGMLGRPLKTAIMKNNGLSPEEYNLAQSYSFLYGDQNLKNKLTSTTKAGLSIRFMYDLINSL